MTRLQRARLAKESGQAAVALPEQQLRWAEASHVMLFVPHGQAVTWSAGREASPILGADGSPFEPTVLLIPVRRWSDGSPAPSPATEHQHSP